MSAPKLQVPVTIQGTRTEKDGSLVVEITDQHAASCSEQRVRSITVKPDGGVVVRTAGRGRYEHEFTIARGKVDRFAQVVEGLERLFPGVVSSRKWIS